MNLGSPARIYPPITPLHYATCGEPMEITFGFGNSEITLGIIIAVSLRNSPFSTVFSEDCCRREVMKSTGTSHDIRLKPSMNLPASVVWGIRG